MAETMEVESGATSDNEVLGEQGLQRDDGLLPDDGATGPNIDAMRRLGEPTRSFVFPQQVRSISLGSEPRRIDGQAFGKALGEMV